MEENEHIIIDDKENEESNEIKNEEDKKNY